MIKNRGDKWTENEISLAKELYLKGCSFSEIAFKTNHSEWAATKKIQDLGLNNRKILWTDKDIETLKDLFNKGLSYPEIAEKMGKTVRACQGKAVRLGLRTKDCNVWLNNKRSDFWSEKEIKELIQYAEQFSSYKEISVLMGRTVKSISLKLNQLNKHLKKRTPEEESLYRRIYSVDDNYFENIDTQKKAYWLGWMVTDGYVLSKLNTKRGVINTNSIGLKLSEKDIDVLKDFKNDLKADVDIQFVKRRSGKVYKNKITNKETFIQGGNQAELRFSSAKMVQDLEKYGIHQNKTYDIGFPKVLDRKFYSGFIAGVISGDGCIDIRLNHGKTKLLRCIIAGNYELVEKIHSILVKEIGVNAEKTISKCKGSAQLYRLELNQTETINLYYWFKKNGVKLMERKNKMIEDYLAEKEFKAA